MKALNPYQQAILTELGIVQWRLRAPDKLALQPEISVSDNGPAQIVADVPEQVSVAQREPSSLHTEQGPAQNHTLSQPVPEQNTHTEPQRQPAQHVDSQHRLFQDIQCALAWLQEDEGLDWQIAEKLSFDGRVLSAPAPQTLSQTPQLKKQLWQLLQHQA